MNNRPKRCSVVLLGLALLLTISLVACGQPEWCDDKWTTFINWEYGYTVTYPLTCSMTYSDSEYLHYLSIFFADGVSRITVRVYKDMDSDNVESLFQRFKDDILAASEEDVGFTKRYDYEILTSFEKEEFFKEIHYTFTKAQIDIRSYKWREANMAGQTWWYLGEYTAIEFIYSFTYETLVGCKKCIWVCDQLSLECYISVSDNTQ